MEIDLALLGNSDGPYRSSGQLFDFLQRDNVDIRRWHDAIYSPQMTSFMAKNPISQASLVNLRALPIMITLDPMNGLKMAVDYFRKLFQVQYEIPIRIVDDNGIDFDVWSIAYRRKTDLYNYTIVEPELTVSKNSFFRAPIKEIIGSISHEIWHARQDEVTNDWLRQTSGLIDLSNANPDDESMRGALYFLNIQAYIFPRRDNIDRYRSQLVEAEAEIVRQKVENLLKV